MFRQVQWGYVAAVTLRDLKYSDKIVSGSLVRRYIRSHVVDYKQTQPNLVSHSQKMSFIIEERGSENTLDYRVFIKDASGPISPFHDIPLWADESKSLVNMVVEIPRWTNAKMEIDTKSTLNPIKQDSKAGLPRYVANVFPHHGYIWNYGALPQTWEDPEHLDARTNAKGDDDPIDVLEIGSKVFRRGEVRKVKVIGALALLDQGETDWKLLAIDSEDPDFHKVNDASQLDELYPGLLRATVEWFRLYKVPDGKKPNEFAFDGKALGRDESYAIIKETHDAWKRLAELSNAKPVNSDLCRDNVCVEGSKFRLSREQAAEALSKHAPKSIETPKPVHVDKCFYVSNL